MVREHVLSKSNRFDEWSAHALLHQCLDWLPGAPVADGSGDTVWLQADSRSGDLSQTTIDSEKMRRAQFAIKKLRQEKRRKLKRWLPDPVNYLDRLEHLLELLKQPHEKRSVQFSRLFTRRWVQTYDQIHKSHPALRRLLHAIAFIQLSQREPAGFATLDWIQENADALVKIQRGSGSSRESDAAASETDILKLQITLYLICQDVSPKWLAVVLRVLGTDPESLDVDTAYFNTQQLCEQFAKASKERPAQSVQLKKTNQLRSSIIQHVDWLLKQKPQRRRAASRVLASLVDEQLFRDIEFALDVNATQQAKMRCEIKRCKSMGSYCYAITLHNESVQIAELLNHEQCKCESLQIALGCLDVVIEVTQRLSAKKPWAVDVSRFFAVIENLDWQTQVSMLHHWDKRCGCESATKEQSYQQALRKLTPLIARRGVSKELKHHWISFEIGNPTYAVELVSTLAEDKLSDDEWSKTVRLVEQVVMDGPPKVKTGLISNLLYFARHAPTLELAHESILLINEQKDYVPLGTNSLRLAFLLSQNAAVVTKLVPKLNEDETHAAVSTILGNASSSGLPDSSSGLPGLVCRQLLAGEKRSLQRLERHIEAVAATGQEVAKLEFESQDSISIARYPVELHDSLERLNRVIPDAEAVADVILRRVFPSPERVAAEIEKLQAKLKQEHLSADARQNILLACEKMNRRLTNPKHVGSGRLNNLADKILKRVDRETIERFIESCQRQLKTAFKRFDPDAIFSPRLFDWPYHHLLPAVLNLTGRERKIAIALLLRADDESKNQQPLARKNQCFVGQMSQRGIDMTPWLARETTQVQNDAGETFQVGFATDTLELLMMGFHFDTCLSPTSFNFYSAVANTIDVNKQVLYCRNADGVIVGRCLFALTADGRIQTYRRYLHDAKLDFEGVVDQFALDLANRMGTSLTSTGTVRKLIAKNWYDDGATTGGLALLTDHDEDSAIVQLLKTTSPESLVNDLCKLVGSRATVRNCLDTLLEKSALTNRPELVIQLAKEFGGDAKTQVIDKMALAVIAFHCDEAAIAFGILDALDHKKLIRRMRRGRYEICPDVRGVGTEKAIIDLLLGYDIQLAKRFIVATRDHDILNDEQEKRDVRRMALAKIHSQLGRDDLAKRLQARRGRK